ncbi:MAG: hypothetical protein ACRC3J_01885 [Culicoidibacterales bacterium]
MTLLATFNDLVLKRTTDLNIEMVENNVQDIGQCGFAEARIFFGRRKTMKETMLSYAVAVDSQEKYCGKSYHTIHVKPEYSPRLRNQTRDYAIKCEQIILNAAIEVFGLENFETRVHSWLD